MQKTDTLVGEERDVEQLKAFMALSAEEKLQHLEQLNAFLQQAMPVKCIEAWEKLKQQGF